MKEILLAILTLCVMLSAEILTRKAVVTTTDGSSQEVFVIEESADSLKIKVFDSFVTMPKNKIKSIVYHQQQASLEKIDQKLDTVITLQKNTNAALKNNSLGNRKFGVEANLFRLLYSKDGYYSTSATISLFGVDRGAEIAFPLFYSNLKSDNGKMLQVMTADCHYRYFLNFYDNLQNGFYISGMTRYAHLYGTLGDNEWFSNHNNYKKGSEDKLGIGFGFGYRIFSKRGLYWGFSITAGRYLVGDNNKFTGDFFNLDDDSEYFYDMELLKFGWAF